jgi:hypothetical protein
MVVSTKNQELSIKNVVFSKLKERLDVCVCVCFGWDFIYRIQEMKKIKAFSKEAINKVHKLNLIMDLYINLIC